MPSTHTSLHYHLVFSTKDRYPSIRDEWRDELHRYLGGTIKALQGIALEVGGTQNHVHILFGLKPVHVLADVVRDVKSGSTGWVREKLSANFGGWQDGYGAFTVSRSAMAEVGRYVREQESHHRRRSFEDEYVELLDRHGIEYDERYLW